MKYQGLNPNGNGAGPSRTTNWRIKWHGDANPRTTGAKLGFEATLWQAADALRGHMDASEYKHVVLGLIFLKYISDAFTEHYDKLKTVAGADPEDRDEYTAENVFWVPQETGFGESLLLARLDAKQWQIFRL